MPYYYSDSSYNQNKGTLCRNSCRASKITVDFWCPVWAISNDPHFWESREQSCDTQASRRGSSGEPKPLGVVFPTPLAEDRNRTGSAQAHTNTMQLPSQSTTQIRSYKVSHDTTFLSWNPGKPKSWRIVATHTESVNLNVIPLFLGMKNGIKSLNSGTLRLIIGWLTILFFFFFSWKCCYSRVYGINDTAAAFVITGEYVWRMPFMNNCGLSCSIPYRCI